MSIPHFDSRGDLPAGVHRASLAEVVSRFKDLTAQRQLATARLVRVYEIARRTGKLERFIIFGSYVTSKADPNDVDIVLVMGDDFTEQDYNEDLASLLDHRRAQAELGASVFWTRPSAILLGTVDEFVAHWQVKRDLSHRGIVEIVTEVAS